MFQVEPILWLQHGLAIPGLAWTIQMVTNLGYSWVYLAAFLVIGFGVRLRPMLGVLLAMIIVGLATDTTKLGFALPRPNEVDERVLRNGRTGTHLVTDGGAETFWGLPSPEAIEAKRALIDPSYGFISGHASAAMVFVLALALFFRGTRGWNGWIWGGVVAWPLLMGVSRMALGRHFIADVLGGLAVGIVGAVLAYALVKILSGSGGGARRAWILACAVALGLTVATLFTPLIDPEKTGDLLGMLICMSLLRRIGYPEDDAGLGRRAARVVLAFGIFVGLAELLDLVHATGGWPDRHISAFFLAAFGLPAATFGTLATARALKLYRPAEASAGAPGSPFR